MRPAPATEPAEALAAALARLERLHPRTVDLSLGRIRRLLDGLGRPERRLPPVLHVAGTNGKGSLLAYARAALEAEGRRVHVYTSPHLVRFNERIRLAGRTIGDDALLARLEEVERRNAGQPITFFEATTAAAFLAFAETPGDILLLETGLGGRLDATNMVERPLLTAITPVSHDHGEFLGGDLAGIAVEKAGILKPGVPAVIGPQPEPAAAAIARRADEIGAPLFRHGADWTVEAAGAGLRYRSALGERRLPRPNLAGDFQAVNAGTAVACLERLGAFAPGGDAIARGLASADWPARLQRLTRGPLAGLAPPAAELWLDGGHNPDAGRALAQSLAAWPPRPLHLVFGMLASKDPTGFLAPFRPLRPKVHWVAVDGHAHVTAEACSAVCRALDLELRLAGTPKEAVREIARTSSETPPRILVCGSLYLAGDVLAANG